LDRFALSRAFGEPQSALFAGAEFVGLLANGARLVGELLELIQMGQDEPAIEEKYEMASALVDYWRGRFIEMQREFVDLQIRHSRLAEHHNKHCPCGDII
jgi:hypothetical protein